MKIPNLRGYLLWWTDFVTEFKQGALRGLLPGSGAGGGSAGVAKATTEIDANTLALIGAGAAASVILSNGLINAVIWARQNPIPNPFREPPTPQKWHLIK